MAIAGSNAPYAKQNLNITKPSFSKVEGQVDPNHKSAILSFADVLKTNVQNTHTNWMETEAKVRDVVMGNADSETVIPLVAQASREIETLVTIVEKSTATLNKILDTNV